MPTIVKGILSLAIISFLLWRVGSANLLAELSSVSPMALVPLILITIPLLLISVSKWRVFLRFFEIEESFFRLIKVYLIGYFFGAVLPAHVGGDAVRSLKLGKRVGYRAVICATILERYTGFIAMVLYGLVSVLITKPEGVWVRETVLLIALASIVLSLIVLSPNILQQITNYSPKRLQPLCSKLKALQLGLRQALLKPSVLAKSMVLSLMFYGGAIINIWLAARAVGWEGVDFIAIGSVLPLILLLGNLPITPSGFGLQEGAFFFFLQCIGSTPAQAMSIALLLRLKWLILVVLGGGVWLLEKAEPEAKEP